jgi:hypothetical protein
MVMMDDGEDGLLLMQTYATAFHREQTSRYERNERKFLNTTNIVRNCGEFNVLHLEATVNGWWYSPSRPVV